MGGMIGSISGPTQIERVSSTVAINAGNTVGGLIGLATGNSQQYPLTLDRCSTSADFTGEFIMGGLIGESRYVNISRSFSTGNLTNSSTASRADTGGLVGRYLMGASIRGRVEFSFSSGDINSAGNNVGGLIGYAELVQLFDVFSLGDVSGNEYIGGLTGYADSVSYGNAYVAGSINGNARVGVFTGLHSYSVHGMQYWNTDRNGQTYPHFGEGLTEYQLSCMRSANEICEGESRNPFVTWSAAEWDFGENTDYPALIWDAEVYRDSDNDGLVDPIDTDDDNDGIADISDNCPTVSNPTAVDFDGDGLGDACDNDDDNDGMSDVFELAYNVSDPDADADADGLSNLEEALLGSNPTLSDSDSDDIDDNIDNCPSILNPKQINDDSDSFGNECDVDDDNDGLIEVATLQVLDLIRADLLGQSLNGDSRGCPASQCQGYELTSNLNFDSDGDDDVDVNDHAGLFWNNGLGWSPVGTYSNPFRAVFDGNQYTISNLRIERPLSSINAEMRDYMGLFGSVDGATLTQINIDGVATHVDGRRSIGLLAGYAKDSDISYINTRGEVLATSLGSEAGGVVGRQYQGIIRQSFSAANVTAETDAGGIVGNTSVPYYNAEPSVFECFAAGQVTTLGTSANAGGLVGSSIGSDIANSYASATVNGLDNVGGLVGTTYNNANIIDSFAVSTLIGIANNSGGLVGLHYGDNITNSYSISSLSANAGGLVGSGSSNVVDSYWGMQESGVSTSMGGVSLSTYQLQCTVDNSTICAGESVNPFGNWNAAVWSFGSNSQYPTLMSDLDGDGLYNSEEDLNLNGLVDAGESDFLSADSDGDGIEDGLDAFPLNPLETLDSDADGVGDNSDQCPATVVAQSDNDRDGCDDISEDADDDNDGVLDVNDDLPLDPSESIDTDGDLIGNNADKDDDNDGHDDIVDAFPLDASEWLDSDGDLIGNNADTDDDNDGILDIVDAFAFDAAASKDNDGDGLADEWHAGYDQSNSTTGLILDNDDDNDGYSDQLEISQGTDPLMAVDTPVDFDKDFIPDNIDRDDDQDGMADWADPYPFDSSKPALILTQLHSFYGDNASDQMSAAAALGDVNGDGYDDFVVAAENESASGGSHGGVRLISGADYSTIFH